MYRKLILCLCTVLLSTVIATAQDAGETKKEVNPVTAEGKKTESTAVDEGKKTEGKAQGQAGQTGAKALSGMSIVGNDEAPKSLYIVPWKSSELSVETSLDMMLTEGDVPVDRDVFKRLLEFYDVSNEK